MDEGYYEYEVIALTDDDGGRIDPVELKECMNELGRGGWRLKCVATNEIGKTSRSIGIGGASGGVNATIEDTVLIFERFVYLDHVELPSL